MNNLSFNPLQHIHYQLMELQQTVKQRICEECNWSLPTYYRKVKNGEISNAEKEKIIVIVYDQLRNTWDHCSNGNDLPPAAVVAPL
ncbi:hypothetical protein [uncultured Chitinophaga sp.]|jgi:hypothetical protein|uniref:hypothetical protein n=1 Tax=uncultured Chitinophaga sp. TaxID=339340 RepID=UPI0026270549|nr:hypothetical protein [uncultured Chitinophaga sp.]